MLNRSEDALAVKSCMPAASMEEGVMVSWHPVVNRKKASKVANMDQLVESFLATSVLHVERFDPKTLKLTTQYQRRQFGLS
ncbi:hypothetical protein [Rhodanobacter sp. MP1X3]|uniref:hypothetical protein n=1 Tax=Rhodanobacter sp. MP1X3 TaxID=2723086 RepID=UPI001620AD25|nr:hypothetical protein [Rhodanobacter sp. MP1X3]MBB6242124.1 hypothetical protein [Rhodanobacter sp. MP1X3]